MVSFGNEGSELHPGQAGEKNVDEVVQKVRNGLLRAGVELGYQGFQEGRRDVAHAAGKTGRHGFAQAEGSNHSAGMVSTTPTVNDDLLRMKLHICNPSQDHIYSLCPDLLQKELVELYPLYRLGMGRTLVLGEENPFVVAVEHVAYNCALN